MPKPLPLIRNRILLAGKTISRDPYASLTPRRLVSITTTSATSNRLGLPLWGGDDEPVFPNIRQPFDLGLPWPLLLEPGILDWVDTVAGFADPIPVVIWRPSYSVLDADGVKKDFYAWREQALIPYTPPDNLACYAPWVDVFDDGANGNPIPDHTTDPANEDGVVQDLTLVPTSTIDTGDPNPGEVWIEDTGRIASGKKVTKIRLGTAPPKGRNVVRVQFIPIYWCFIRQTGAMTYDKSEQETRSLSLTEAF